MERLEKHDWLMQIARVTADRSTCCRIQVGAVIEKYGRIISTGYNGSAPGAIHCMDYFKKRYTFNQSFLTTEEFKKMHHEWALRNEIHAEINAIIFAARRGIAIENAHMYVTHMPCITCAKYIVQSGITRIFYRHEYSGETDIAIFNNVEIKQI